MRVIVCVCETWLKREKRIKFWFSGGIEKRERGVGCTAMVMEVKGARSAVRSRRRGRLCCYDVPGRVRAARERRMRRMRMKNVQCRAQNDDDGRDDDDGNLDWEPEKRRARARANRKTPSGTGFEREAVGAEPARPRFALRSAVERMPLEDVNGSDSRRKAIAVVAAVAAGIAFIANGSGGGSSNGGNGMHSLCAHVCTSLNSDALCISLALYTNVCVSVCVCVRVCVRIVSSRS